MTPSPSLGVAAGVALAAVALLVARPWNNAVAPPPAAGLVTPAAPPATPLRPPTPMRAVVYVAGAVLRPGVYAVASDARVADAVARAGGLGRDADPIAVNLAAHVTDGEEIAVPRVGQMLAAAARSAAPGAPSQALSRHGHSGRRRRRASGPTAPAAGPGSPVDLNLADAATLETIPGIGPTLAERIVTFRTMTGPFASVDGLADVSGITPSRLDAIAPYLTVRQP